MAAKFFGRCFGSPVSCMADHCECISVNAYSKSRFKCKKGDRVFQANDARWVYLVLEKQKDG